MRHWSWILAAIILLVCGVAMATDEQPGVEAAILEAPVAFTKNVGQWPDSILFRADAGGATMWFLNDGVYYQFTRRIPTNDSVSHDPMDKGLDRQADSIETMMIKAEFVGAKPDATVEGKGVLAYKCNYFLGNDRSKWATDVPNYRSVVMRNVYPGIDVHLESSDEGCLVYRYELAAGAETARVEVGYEGVEEVMLDQSGGVVVDTRFGEMSGLLAGPGVESGAVVGKRQAVVDAAALGSPTGTDRNSKGVELLYSTYLGGSNDDDGHGIAVDGSGCAYVTGGTQSADFPTENAWDDSYNGIDFFVTKLSAASNSLLYSTYLGGSNSDHAYGIAVDASGCAYVTGMTQSTDFPTENAWDSTHNGDYDAFVTKLSAAGGSLIYSTYLGGSDFDQGWRVAIDDSGCAYVMGQTGSSDFPTQNAWDDSYNDGHRDAFVTKLSAGGNSLIYSTYLGGAEHELGGGIAVDGSGCAYVTGYTEYTESTPFPTENAWDDSHNGGSSWEADAFVTKLSAAGNSLIYSTYLGGSHDDFGFGIAIDDSGCAYVTGWTVSTDFPTESAWDDSYNGSDVFVTKFSPAGDNLVYSTYLGGSSEDVVWGIAVDDSGCAYVTGETSSTDFPTENAWDDSYNGGYKDAFVTKLSPAGNSLTYSTYLGGSGSGSDCGKGIAVDDSGCAYVTGGTNSTDFPTENAWDDSYNGGPSDAFVTKLSALADQSVCCDIRADINHNGAGPDIADLVYLVNYMFQTGPQPPCFEEADINGDGSDTPDIADLVYLVTYMFQGGPAPVPCE